MKRGDVFATIATSSSATRFSATACPDCANAVLQEFIRRSAGVRSAVAAERSRRGARRRRLHEIKHDGFRTLLAIGGGRARCYTRRGHDWSDRYARIVDAAPKLDCRSALIDGEIIVQDEAGRSSMEALYDALAGEPHRIVFFAFDLLQLDG